MTDCSISAQRCQQAAQMERNEMNVSLMGLLGGFIRQPHQLFEIAFFQDSYWNAFPHKLLSLSVFGALLVTREPFDILIPYYQHRCIFRDPGHHLAPNGGS